jgi:hypothetical protein
MNSTLKSALAFSAIAVGTAGLSAAIGLRENACPAPTATSVEALFAPCLAQTANATQPLPADLPAFLARPGFDLVPGPAPTRPASDQPAIAKARGDIESTGSVAPE